MARQSAPAPVERPWGAYQVLFDEAGAFRVKRLCIRPGQRISYQRHGARAEHWYVVSGRGRVTLDDVDRDVGPGSGVDVGVGVAHRVANTDAADLVVVEVQTGPYLGEDDIERLSDDYGRVPAHRAGGAAQGSRSGSVSQATPSGARRVAPED